MLHTASIKKSVKSFLKYTLSEDRSRPVDGVSLPKFNTSPDCVFLFSERKDCSSSSPFLFKEVRLPFIRQI